jgi:hypothetical protein
MPYTTVVAGQVITAAWANANIRDQVITPFASAATRAAAITAPVTGMCSYITATGIFDGYNGSVWAAASGQIIARGSRITSSAAVTAETAVLRVPVGTLTSGHAYRISTCALSFYSTAANDTVCGRIRYTTDGSAPTTASAIMPGTIVQTRLVGAGIDEHRILSTEYVAGAGVNLTLLLTVARSAGTGNVQFLSSADMPILVTVMTLGKDQGNVGVAL